MSAIEAAPKKGLPLHMQMLIGFLVGLVGGLLVHSFAKDAAWVGVLTNWVTQPVGGIFLNLIFMLVIPLLFSALVMGVSEMGEIRALGRAGWKTLAYTVAVSAIAVVIGLVMVNIFQPGVGVDQATAQGLIALGRNTQQAAEATQREHDAVVAQQQVWNAVRRLVRAAVLDDPHLSQLYAAC